MGVRAAPPAVEASFQTLVKAGSERARRTRRAVLVSLTVPAPPTNPVELFARGQPAAAEAFFWGVPEAGRFLVGLGAAQVLVARGVDRFAQVARAWSALAAGALIRRPAGYPPRAGAASAGPVAFAGFAFDPERPNPGSGPDPAPEPEPKDPREVGSPGALAGAPVGPPPDWVGFPEGLLVLPRVTYGAAGGRAWITMNAVALPGGGAAGGVASMGGFAPAAAGASAAAEVAAFLRAAGAAAGPAGEAPWDVDRAPGFGPDGAGVELPPKGGSNVPGVPTGSAAFQAQVRAAAGAIRAGRLDKVVLARAVHLRSRAPFNPAVALRRLAGDHPACTVFCVAREGRAFLGATPERLVRLEGGVVQTDCLAGSTARGRTAEGDRRLGEALLDSAKDRQEHAVVLQALREGLEAAGVATEAPVDPGLLKLGNVQHLHTPVTGRAAPGTTVLDLVARLHPTPAVGGHPRAAALRWIREREGLDRGWYAGPVGWLDLGGEGEFGVAIRSALVDGPQAWCFAGCGIMADSEPAAEDAEAGLKLRPMLAALGGGR